MAETFIHPAAVVEDGAQIGEGAQIGPFCHIGPHAVIGSNVVLLSHVSVMNATRIGDGTKVYPNATLGGPPQDTKHKGSVTRLEIGRNCKIRENVTMHVGSDASSGVTMVGDDGFFLANSHVAHDCVVGNNVTLTHGATLGGHCEIGDHAIVGGLTGVHQFVRVGRRAFLGGSSAVMGDVIPYGMVVGNRAKLHGHAPVRHGPGGDLSHAGSLSPHLRSGTSGCREPRSGSGRVCGHPFGDGDRFLHDRSRQALLLRTALSESPR